MLNNELLTFQNSFVEFVFYAILSEKSRSKLEDMLTDTVLRQVFKENQIRKLIVKSKPQQVIIFVSKSKKSFVVKGFQLGRTDYLTGRKKAHLNTIQEILTTKTQEEIEKLY
ncbi:hypothetical protein B0186_08875 [Canicola haemoglobinophilus]|uniref:Uncharacterized protein n=1 Tax=Canicola haemoglobinophilus TaxID=733 RepID=A0A1V4AZN0_9PAST|nr:hypothetical protein [Canicola haemoglobinophilus]OOR98669.1 hypothetical protein B0186_08875 [Canicola haemoglobinophilus]STO53911.1 Uncharacterised protein [Canicola haemoglobinophilus]STO60652.1 Uncharacterised protein [Canicola haemoglobinophilus]STO68444.1 Uncharacterised protein [Canicola haemoglobinophilus]